MKPSYLFWKISLGILISTLVAVVITLYSARLSEQFVCMKLSTYDASFNRQQQIADTNRLRSISDYRQSLTSYLSVSPDRNFWLGYQARGKKIRAGDLVLSSGTSPINNSDVSLIQPNITTDYTSYDQFRYILWAPDSKRFAYLWVDGTQLFVSLATVDGAQRRTALVTDAVQKPLQSTIAMGSWSPDGKYFTLGWAEKDSRNLKYEIWDATTLQRVNTAAFSTGEWSPRGHQFAGLRALTPDQYLLAIWTPESESVNPIKMNPIDKPLQISWSPNGGYIVLHSSQPCQMGVCSRQWRYDIWDRTGQTVASDLAGSEKVTEVPSDFRYYVSPESAWTNDERTFVFVQTSERLHYNLMALHLPEATVETLETNLVEGFLSSLFYVNWNFYSLTSKIGTALNTRMLMISQHDDKIKVELATLDGKDRIVLVENAARLLSNRSSINAYWSTNGEFVIIPWFSNRAISRIPPNDAHLTWSRADGTGLHQIDDLSDLQNPDVISLTIGNKELPLALAYTTHYGEGMDHYALEMVDLDGINRVRLLDDLTAFHQWNAVVSPIDHSFAIVTGFEVTYVTNPNTHTTNRLYLVSPDGKRVTRISDDVIGTTQWSPDGKRVAYLSYDTTNRKTYLNAVSGVGEPISKQKLPIKLTDQLMLWGWSKCG